jgi:hypothetical protein
MTVADVILEDPIRDYLRLYVKGDDDLIEHLLITCFSSYTANPINLGVMAPTSEGKTYPINWVTSLFPNAMKFTGATAKSFFYDEGTEVDLETGEDIQGRLDDINRRLDELESERGKDAAAERRELKAERKGLRRDSATKVSLGGRILVFLDSPDFGLWNALKPLLSHDSYTSVYQTVAKGATGTQKTRKILLVGWPACIFASARNEDRWDMWPEIQSRFVIVSPKMDPGKYKMANQLNARLLGYPSFALRQLFPEKAERSAKDEVSRIRKVMGRIALLGHSEGSGSRRDNFVFNPFMDWLAAKFPFEAGTRMRQFRYMMGYSNILTLINSDRRCSVIMEGQTRAFVSHLEDVTGAVSLILSELASPLPRYKLDFYRQFIVPCYDANIDEQSGKLEAKKPFTVRQLMEYCESKGRRAGRKWLTDTILGPLEEAGYLDETKDPEDKRKNQYQPLETVQESGIIGELQNFDPQLVKESLKSLQNLVGERDLQMLYALPDASFAGDFQRLADVILGAHPPTDIGAGSGAPESPGGQ